MFIITTYLGYFNMFEANLDFMYIFLKEIFKEV